MGGKQGEKAFRQAVERVWGKRHKPGLYRVGKGTLAVGMSIQEALEHWQDYDYGRLLCGKRLP